MTRSTALTILPQADLLHLRCLREHSPSSAVPFAAHHYSPTTRPPFQTYSTPPAYRVSSPHELSPSFRGRYLPAAVSYAEHRYLSPTHPPFQTYSIPPAYCVGSPDHRRPSLHCYFACCRSWKRRHNLDFLRRFHVHLRCRVHVHPRLRFRASWLLWPRDAGV